MKSWVSGKIKDVLQTLFRWFPFPAEPGLRRCGNPGKNSPVFLTTNFDLTLRRVMKALKGQDCYLLAVNTKGINAWCSAKGGNFTAHQVISAIKLSNITDLVDHRRLILPQLCACGVDPEEVKNNTGWEVIFGPVHAWSLPQYIKNGFSKTEEMATVQTRLRDRLEVAVCWSWMISLLCLVPAIFFFGEFLILLLILIWGMTFFIFSLWHYLPGRLGIVKGLFAGVVFMVTISAYMLLVKDFSPQQIFKLNVGIFLISVFIGIDSAGATTRWRTRVPEWVTRIAGKKGKVITKILYSENKCNGCERCLDVCPTRCFEMDGAKNRVKANFNDCVQCGACFKQCPTEAFSYT